jgi:cell division protein FtsI/penicillin-binding protein 2
MSRAGLALGQELTVTPLQMAMAYAAIANGGWLPQPELVAAGAPSDPAGVIPQRTRVMDEALARRLQSMLEGVVRDGTGKQAHVPGFRVAGKTGTAQRAVKGGFDDEHHTAWFAGFLPLPEPQIVIVVAVEDPEVRDFWASTVAAPIFADIAGAAASRLGLAATEEIEPDEPPKMAHGHGNREGDRV